MSTDDFQEDALVKGALSRLKEWLPNDQLYAHQLRPVILAAVKRLGVEFDDTSDDTTEAVTIDARTGRSISLKPGNMTLDWKALFAASEIVSGIEVLLECHTFWHLPLVAMSIVSIALERTSKHLGEVETAVVWALWNPSAEGPKGWPAPPRSIAEIARDVRQDLQRYQGLQADETRVRKALDDLVALKAVALVGPDSWQLVERTTLKF